MGAACLVAYLVSHRDGSVCATSFYLFFGVIEILTTLAIVWYAWKWLITRAITENPKSRPAVLTYVTVADKMCRWG